MRVDGKDLSFRVRVVVEPDGEGFHAYCPALRGLHVSGDTLDEALRNAADAACAYITSLIKHNDPLPVGCQEPMSLPKSDALPLPQMPFATVREVICV